MAYKFQLGLARLSGSVIQEGEFKAVGNADDDGLISGSAGLQIVDAALFGSSIAATGSITAGSSFIIGSADLNEADMEKLDGITNGTVAAAKAVVVDSNKDASGFNSLTAVALTSSATVTATGNIIAGGSFVIGSADMNETDLEKLDGITNGTAAANKAIVLGANKNIGGITSLTASTITVSNATTLADDGLTNANGKLALSLSSLGGGAEASSIVSTDLMAMDNGVTRRITFANMTGSIGVSGSMLHSSVAGTNLEVNSNALRIAASAAGDGLDGGGASALSVAAAQTTITSVLNSSMTKIGTATNQEYIKFDTANEVNIHVNDTERFSVTANGFDATGAGTISGNLTVNGTASVAGDLVVQGDLVTLDVATVGITGSFSFEGSTPNGNETVLGVVDPTADRTINLADASGTLIPFAAASTTTISSTPAELNLLDGSAKSTSSITIADSDAFIIIDGNTTKQIPASNIKQFVGDSTNLDVAIKDDGETLQRGVNYFANFSGAESVNLPASPDVGDVIHIKAPANCSLSNTLTINRQGSHTIDGETSVVLESPNAAIMCVYVVANVWKIF